MRLRCKVLGIQQSEERASGEHEGERRTVCGFLLTERRRLMHPKEHVGDIRVHRELLARGIS